MLLKVLLHSKFMAKSTETVFGVRLETQNAFAVPVIVGEVGLIRDGRAHV